jgi:hypothetical protein
LPGSIPFARGVQGHVHRVAQQAPGAQHDDGDDQQAGRRVQPQPAGQHHREGADHHAGRDGGVGGHVQEGAADVEVVLGAAHEHQGRGGVDDDAEAATIITGPLSTEAGSAKRRTASQAMAPVATSSRTALVSEARMVPLRRP